MLIDLKPAVSAAPQDHENARLQALADYNVLGTSPEESFDRIVRLAKRVMDTPIVAVSLIARDIQWFKAKIGVKADQTPREHSFCTHAIERDEPLIIPDTREHPLFRDNVMVTGAPFIRFYMGVPLRSYDGYNVGTLCIADLRPRAPRPEQIAVLQDLAGVVQDELELRRAADTDSLTGLMSRRSFCRDATRALAYATRQEMAFSCLLLDVDHFKKFNDRYGHAVGDQVLQAVADTCRTHLRGMDVIGRLGGEEFVAALPDASAEEALETAERLRAAIADLGLRLNGKPLGITVSIGVSSRNGFDYTLTDLLELADGAMYRAKHAGRNAVTLSRLPPPAIRPAMSLQLEAHALQ